MRVMVAFEHRFIRPPDGRIYTRGTVDYNFLSRYLTVFDEVVVLSRVENVDEEPEVKKLAEGPGVSFFDVPYYYGPAEYLKNYRKVNNTIKQAEKSADVFILRVAGNIGTLLWKNLMKTGTPYGVEVVADPWDSLAPGSIKSKARPILRRIMKWDMIKQCQNAAVASYVTEYALQKRYPPGGWSTYYSTIDMPSEAILESSIVDRRMERVKEKISSGKPLVLCCTGQMSQLYKAQDILIAAFARCLNRGLNIELNLLGDGSYRGQLEQQAKELGVFDRVHFLGNIPAGQEVFEKLDLADIFVLPSRQEGLPRALIEAMARGLPSIGSAVGGFSELIAEKYLVKPSCVESLEDKIYKISTNPEEMKDMSEKNLQKASGYSVDILQKRRNEMYQRLVEITEKAKS